MPNGVWLTCRYRFHSAVWGDVLTTINAAVSPPLRPSWLDQAPAVSFRASTEILAPVATS
jgi:hypothetical protein